jgi:hypothetical protein
MKNTKTILMTIEVSVPYPDPDLVVRNSPHPRIHPNAGAVMIEKGTTWFAFVASSLICTLESNPPTVQRGAKKLKTNANPFGQPYTLVKLPKANEAELWNALGVAAGMAMIMARMRSMLRYMKTCWSLARILVAILAITT